jgi:hypothetical protein
MVRHRLCQKPGRIADDQNLLRLETHERQPFLHLLAHFFEQEPGGIGALLAANGAREGCTLPGA